MIRRQKSRAAALVLNAVGFLAFSGGEGRADLTDPGAIVLEQVNWKIGQMRADPVRNLVYVVDETNNRIVAINTDTGALTTAVDVGEDSALGHLEFSLDGATLYLSTQVTSKVHAFATGSLAHAASVAMPFPVRSFVIGADGYLHAVHDPVGFGGDTLTQIDLSTGAEVGGDENTLRYDDSDLLIRNARGSRLFLLNRHTSGSGGGVVEMGVQFGTIPLYAGEHYNSHHFGKDLILDESRNTLHRAAFFPRGVEVWDMTDHLREVWPFNHRTNWPVAVTHLENSPVVYGISGDDIEGVVRSFRKVDGAPVWEWQYSVDGTQGGDDALDGALEITGNGNLVFAKSEYHGIPDVGIDRSYFFLGLIRPAEPGGRLPPPPNVTASDRAYDNQIVIKWNAVDGATNYTVWRESFLYPYEPIQIGSTTSTAWADASAVPGTDYTYVVKAVRGAFTSGFSDEAEGQMGAEIPADPGIGVSEGTFVDKIRLTVEPGFGPHGISHQIFRGTEYDSDGSGYVIVGTTTGLIWEDFSAEPGTMYYYSAKAVNEAGESGLGFVSEGERSAEPPRVPAGVDATGGAYLDRVELLWNPVFQASAYKVYRHTINDPAGATVVEPAAPSTSWNDSTAEAGTIYYYWVAAVNENGESAMSVPDSGNRAAEVPIPSGVTATDGTDADLVEITWSRVDLATSYQVYRNTVNDPATAQMVDSTIDTSWTDQAAVPGTIYNYWVVALADAETSGFSVSDSGHRALGSPTGVMASDGMYQGVVRINWDEVAGATGYEVWRGTEASGDGSARVGTSTGVEFEDSGGTPAVEYFYFVKATAGPITGEISTGESGYGTVGLPFRPDGLIGKKRLVRIGDGVYVTGRAQELKQLSKRLRKLKWYLDAENDGDSHDRLTVSLTRGNGFFKAVMKTAAGANVTAAATRSRLMIDLSESEKAGYVLQVKPTRRAKRKAKRRIFTVSARSGMDPSMMDGVRAKAETKK